MLQSERLPEPHGYRVARTEQPGWRDPAPEPVERVPVSCGRERQRHEGDPRPRRHRARRTHGEALLERNLPRAGGTPRGRQLVFHRPSVVHARRQPLAERISWCVPDLESPRLADSDRWSWRHRDHQFQPDADPRTESCTRFAHTQPLSDVLAIREVDRFSRSHHRRRHLGDGFRTEFHAQQAGHCDLHLSKWSQADVDQQRGLQRRVLEQLHSWCRRHRLGPGDRERHRRPVRRQELFDHVGDPVAPALRAVKPAWDRRTEPHNQGPCRSEPEPVSASTRSRTS